MGTWISHLRIAENLLEAIAGLDEAAFTCGSLAPDSGIPNADWTVFDPPKEVTHFLLPGEDEGRINDMEFHRRYLAGLTPDNDLVQYSFILGYFFHLLCDNLWSRRIVATTKAEFAARLAARGPQAWSDFKDDWYGLDQRYVCDHRGSLFWRVLMTAPNPPAHLPYVSEAALHQQLDYIRRFYSQPDAAWALDRPYPFLNEATMTRYVNDSTASLLKIHAQLQQQPHLDHTHTALTLLHEREFAPYDPPLGDAKLCDV